MPLSMTGFGAAQSPDGRVQVDARSVNHRYLDVRWHGAPHLQTQFAELEPVVREYARRGRIDIRVAVRDGPEGPDRIDLEAAQRWIQAARELEALGADPGLGVSTLLQLPGVVREETTGPTVSIAELREVLGAALYQLRSMRRREGENTRSQLLGHLEQVGGLVHSIRDLAASAVPSRVERLRQRVMVLLQQGLEAHRLHQEAVLLADRMDVMEELERLSSHRSQFRELLGSEESVGRRLDFLLQEMNREVTTIGSKLPDAGTLVVELKAEMERLREQVQNIE